MKEEEPTVQMSIPDEQQAEKIADQFSEISHLYSPLRTEDINLNCIIDERPPPEINPYLVYLFISSYLSPVYKRPKQKTATHRPNSLLK